MVVEVNIGRYSIKLTAYNPASGLSLLFCRMLLERVQETFNNMPEAEALSWVEEHVPGAGELVQAIRNGAEPVREFGIGEYPVDPQNVKEEMRIIAWLQEERARQE